MNNDDIRNAVYRTIVAVNDLLPEEQYLDAKDELVLVGKHAQLDSMGFVNFIVALQEELEEELKVSVDMADLLSIQNGDETMSTVADLIKMLEERLA
jgi:acyl carrier protein